MANNRIPPANESDATLSRWAQTQAKLLDWLQEQVWFQELKTQWDEWDPQNKRSFLWIASLVLLLLCLTVLLKISWSVQRAKREFQEKRELLTLLQDAQEEIRDATGSTPHAPDLGSAKDNEGNWSEYLLELGQPLQLTPTDHLTVTPNLEAKLTPADSDQYKERLYDLQLTHVTLKQITKYALQLETGRRIVKIRNLQVETQSDAHGYLNAKIALSVFTLLAANP